MHPLKRRKVEHDQGSSATTKPFRSPLRADVPRLPTAEGEIQTHTTTGHSEPGTAAAVDSSHNHSASPSSSSPTKIDPTSVSEPATLQKEYAALSRQLTSLRQSLDTAQQALKIQSGQQDVLVQAMIAKWKGVIRDAAEDLFKSAKEAFNNQSVDERHQDSRQLHFWDEEERQDLTQEKKQILEMHEAEARDEAERFGLFEKPEPEEETSRVGRRPVEHHESPLIHRVADIHDGDAVAAGEH